MEKNFTMLSTEETIRMHKEIAAKEDTIEAPATYIEDNENFTKEINEKMDLLAGNFMNDEDDE